MRWLPRASSSHRRRRVPATTCATVTKRRTIRRTREGAPGPARAPGALRLSGPADPDKFPQILEGRVPDGLRLGRRGRDGEIRHRPVRDVILSAPKLVLPHAMAGGDDSIVEAHDWPLDRILAGIEEHAVPTRMQDKAPRGMVLGGGEELAPRASATTPRATSTRTSTRNWLQTRVSACWPCAPAPSACGELLNWAGSLLKAVWANYSSLVHISG